jgi:hypothetical protein
MEQQRPLQSISDDELLRRLAELLRQHRRREADLVAHIGEVEERRLYAREASPSMFIYCTEVLHLSEAEAYLRIAVARASREHPMLLTMMGDGRLHLTGAARLAPFLTQENRDELLKRATHRSRRQIEELIAEIAPRPDVPALMRKLPGCRSKAQPPVVPSCSNRGAPSVELGFDQAATPDLETGLDGAAVRRAELCPDRFSPGREGTHGRSALAPARYKIQFTASAALHDKLERLRALMRSQVPDGDLAAILEEAITEKLERLEARRHAKTSTPRKGLSETDSSSSSRHVPAAIRRAVRERDGNRCRYVDKQGRRCPERHRLEYHHRHPFGFGGDLGLQNICLMCHGHNQYLAEHDYGREAMARHRGSGSLQRQRAQSSLEGP